MSRIPFPHILTEPNHSNKFLLRFVQPEKVIEGEILMEYSHMQENLKTREFEPVARAFLIKEIIEARPARGDWTAYEEHPNYYACVGEYMGVFFKSNLHEPLYIS